MGRERVAGRVMMTSERMFEPRKDGAKLKSDQWDVRTWVERGS